MEIDLLMFFLKKRENELLTSFTAAIILASIGGLGGATVGRLIMAGAGRMLLLTELIASCD